MDRQSPIVTVTRLDADHYHLSTVHGTTPWRDSIASREQLHSLLVNAGYKRIKPAEDGDPLTGEYRWYGAN